jgi:N utilization substance protein A
MSKELLLVVDAVANEKGVPREVIFDAMEAALASAAKKRYPDEDPDIRVEIDRNTGDYETFRRWEIVADDVEMEDPSYQIRLMDAEDEAGEGEVAEIGGAIEHQVENAEFGRIAAQAAKQVIVQRVREAERQQVVDQFVDRVGELVTGIVKRVERGNVYLDLGSNAEAFIPRDKTIPRESARVGDRVRGYLYEVKSEIRGPQLFVSRSTDPIGACIGMRGSRVQAVSNELNGERVDIILWHDNQAQYVINAMAPAEVQSIIMDEEKHSMDIAVAEDKLSQAIGRGGQNVRLASKLTGWQLNVMTQDQVTAKSEAEQAAALQLFQDKLEVDEEIASILVQEGFSSIEEIAYVPSAELLNVEGFDEDIVEELRARARDALLTEALAAEEGVEENPPSEELLGLDGMDDATAFALADRGVKTLDDLGDLAVDELIDIDGMTEERASQLIMAARAPMIARLEKGG